MGLVSGAGGSEACETEPTVMLPFTTASEEEAVWPTSMKTPPTFWRLAMCPPCYLLPLPPHQEHRTALQEITHRTSQGPGKVGILLCPFSLLFLPALLEWMEMETLKEGRTAHGPKQKCHRMKMTTLGS